MEQTFGKLLRQARKDKGYSQRQLAEELAHIDVTYLSKLENDRVDNPSEDVIRSLAQHLDLNAEELIFLAGHIPQSHEKLLKQNYKRMPGLFRKLSEDPEFIDEVERKSTQVEIED